MKSSLKTLLVAIAGAACTAFSAPAEPGCSQRILQQYREVQQTATLNATEARRYTVMGTPNVALPPTVTLLMASDVSYCRTRPQAVMCRGNRNTETLTLEQVTRIDAKLRAEFTYVSDTVLHGRNDWWTNDRTCGDCEDYALILSERLSRAGQAGAGMALMIWAPAPGLGHATLMVQTRDVGLIEIGVGAYETPRFMDWTAGKRAAYMQMDGSRNWFMLAR